MLKKNVSLFLILSCIALLNSCAPHKKLSVFSEYLVPERLASYHVNTPDPLRFCPPVGQRLTIHWLLKEDFPLYNQVSLRVLILFRNHEKAELEVLIEDPVGSYMYDLIRRDYFDKGGMLAYKVLLYGDGELLEEWQHILWVELIEFQQPDDELEK